MRRGALLLLFVAGCSATPAAGPADVDLAPEEEARPAPLARTGNAWADCYRRFQPGADPAEDVARLAASCAAPAGMTALTPLETGAVQGAGDPPERFTFRVRRGRCYRAFAVGSAGVEDLDVAVYDPEGNLAAGDVSRDRWPVVPPRGPACAEADGVYTVVVAVTRGRGDYVMQVWGASAAP